MKELLIDWLAQRKEICLTLEKGPEGIGHIDSFIVLLSAKEAVT